MNPMQSSNRRVQRSYRVRGKAVVAAATLRRSSHLVFTASVIAAGLAIPQSLTAQTWISPNSGSWSVASNWIGGVVPTQGTSTGLRFAASDPQTYTATQNIAEPFTLNSVSLGNFSSAGSIVLSGSSLRFAGTSPGIHVDGGPVAVNNNIQIPGANTGTINTELTISSTGLGPLVLNGALSTTAGPGGSTGALTQNSLGLGVSLSGGGTLFSLISTRGHMQVTGGAWNLTSTLRRNDSLDAIDNGPWSLSIGETAGQTANFTMSGGTLTAKQGFIAVASNSISAATFSNGAVATFDPILANNVGRFGVNAGSGSINIVSGAHVTCRLVEIGRQLSVGTANLMVSGPGSRLDAQQLVHLRLNGAGSITVSNGGVIAITGGSFLASDPNTGFGVPTSSTMNVNSGTFSSDGSLILGTFAVGEGGATLNVSNGGFVSAAAGTTSMLNVRPTGTINIGIGASRGTLVIPAGSANIVGRVNYNAGTFVTAGTLAVTGNVLLSSASRNAAGNPSNKKVVDAGTVALTGSGVIDLNDNDMIVRGGQARADIETYIRTARNNGAWDAPGITSTSAKVHPTHSTTLGMLLGSEYLNTGTTTFNGRLVAPGHVLVKYTWYGDTDFNGKVDGADYARLDAGFQTDGNDWFEGDLDYNNKVDGADYALIDAVFNAQSGTLLRMLQFLDGSDRDRSDMTSPGLRMALAHFDQFGESYAIAALTSIPEPASSVLVPVIAVATIRRRRHR